MKDLRGGSHEAPIIKAPYLKNLLSQTAHPAASSGACSRPFVISRILTNSSAYSLPSLQGFPVFQHNYVLCPPSHHHLLFRYILRHSKIRLPKVVSLHRGIF